MVCFRIWSDYMVYFRPYPFKFFKDCLPQTLLGPFLNILSYMLLKRHSYSEKQGIISSFVPSVALNIKASNLICTANQIFGFYMKCNTARLKLVNLTR